LGVRFTSKESFYILRGFQLSIRRTVYSVSHDCDAGFTDEPQKEIKKGNACSTGGFRISGVPVITSEKCPYVIVCIRLWIVLQVCY
jgi:hypothetical protein